MADNKDVWCVADAKGGKASPGLFELLGEGRKLADALGQKLCVVLIGKGVAGGAELGAYGVDLVRVIDHAAFENFTDEAYARALAELAKKHAPRLILLAGNAFGKSLGPRAAALLPAGLAAEVSELSFDKAAGAFMGSRTCGGGGFVAPVSWTAQPEMATVRLGSFAKAAKQDGKTAEVAVEAVDPSGWPVRTRFKAFSPEESKEIDIGRADVIVAGGYALGGAENFKMLRELANLLGGAVGASRRAVDSGWIPYRNQVGLTGRTVRPKLYIACGISGQIQHLAGMSQSGTVVAINKDPKAPLMELADIRVEADLFEVVPAIIEELKKQKLA